MPKVPVCSGIDLHCYVDDFTRPWEAATPVMMHHGMARNGEFWAPWVPVIAGRRAVYRLDMRGCGKSSVPAEDYAFSAEQMVSDVVAVLDHFGLKSVHWVGCASGGIIGQLVALSHPERISSLVLCSSPARVPDRMRKVLSTEGDSPPEAKRKAGIAKWSADTIDSRLDTAVATPAFVKWYIAQMSKTPTHVAASISDCLMDVDLSEEQRQLEAPALLIFGQNHPDAELQNDMARRFPNGQAFRVQGVGAGAQHIYPELCAARSMQFWEQIDRHYFE